MIIGAVLTVSGCGITATEDPVDLGVSYQAIRERTVRAFVTNPAAAQERYRPVFGLSPRSDKKDLVAKIVVCGQLKSKGMEVNDVCPKSIEDGLSDSNDEVRSIAISALAFSADEFSQDVLIDALEDSSTTVRLEAAQSLNYQFDTLSANPNNPGAHDLLKSKLNHFCSSMHALSTSSSEELCRNVN